MGSGALALAFELNNANVLRAPALLLLIEQDEEEVNREDSWRNASGWLAPRKPVAASGPDRIKEPVAATVRDNMAACAIATKQPNNQTVSSENKLPPRSPCSFLRAPAVLRPVIVFSAEGRRNRNRNRNWKLELWVWVGDTTFVAIWGYGG